MSSHSSSSDQSSDSEYQDEPQNRKKRRVEETRNLANFYDDVASVSGDEDDGDDTSDDDDEDLDGFVTNAEVQEGDIPYIMASEDHTQTDAYITGSNQRWSDYGKRTVREYDEESERERDPQLHDPKLWIVKCKPGTERLVSLDIWRNYAALKLEDKTLQVFSVIALEHLKGYLYVEAFRGLHVQQCLKNVTDVFHSKKIKLVPMVEMKDVLRIPDKKRLLKKGDWVRLRSGLYKGDLAQVNDYDNSSGEALIRLIPRLNLSEWERKYRAEESDSDEEGKGKKRKGGPKIRPPAKFFNREEIQELIGQEVMIKRDTGSGEPLVEFDNQKFTLDGFLLKHAKIRSLDIDNITLSYDEVETFKSSAYTEDPDNPDDTISMDMERAVTFDRLRKERKVIFSKGDNVIVTEGEIKNLTGVVKSYDGDTVKVLIKHSDLTGEILLPTSSLAKHFKVGDHVRVLQGTHEGETGLILKIQDAIAILLTDVTEREIKVLTSDIQLGKEVSTGRSLGDYQLYDLVQLTTRSVAVITRVDRDGFEVIDNFSKVKNIKLPEIMTKVNKSYTSKDANKNSVTSGDAVKVVDGKFKTYQGTVKHVHKQFVFVHCTDYRQNSGIFVIPTKYCTILGTSRNQSLQGVHGYQPLNGDSVRPRVRRKNNHKDPFLNKIVRISAGNWKGYDGTVKDCGKDTFTVELQTNAKRVKVSRNHVKVFQDEQSSYDNSRSSYSSRDISSVEAQTPHHPGFEYDTSSSPPHMYNITTPGIVKIGTPSLNHPLTPAFSGSIPTPHPMTPGLSSPTTPNVVTPYGVSTPGAYVGSPSVYEYTAESVIDKTTTEEDDWWLKNIEVSLEGVIGVIQQVFNNECEVKWNDGSSGRVDGSLLTPTIPQKKDRVVVIRDTYRGKEGELIGIDAEDGIVKFDDLDIEVLPLSHLARTVK